MSKRIFVLQPSPHPSRQNALRAVQEAPAGYAVTIAEPTRNLDQNARMWAQLHDISEQVDWYGKKLTPEDWKHVFSASLRKLEVVPNLDGSGFVALGISTSRMSVREMRDLIELMLAFGAERGVEWSNEERIEA